MRDRRSPFLLSSLGFLLTSMLVAAPAWAQVTVELEAGAGYTVVDIETMAENDGEFARDWGQFMYRFAARAFFGESSGLKVGAEAGYQYFYWYSVRVPYGDTPIYREYDHSGTTVLGVVRLEGGPALVDLGAGVALVDETRPMISASVGANVFAGLSVWGRVDATLTGQVAAPVGVAVSYALSPGGD
jgi:hypothetical protein